jgi:hypothetical protein
VPSPDPAQPPKLKVSCRSCGRINDVPPVQPASPLRPVQQTPT